MGMAMIQCQNHNSQEIKGACRCVTVKVIIPVAVAAVINCSKNSFIVYIARPGIQGKNLAAQKIWVEYLSFQGGDFRPWVLKNARAS